MTTGQDPHAQDQYAPGGTPFPPRRPFEPGSPELFAAGGAALLAVSGGLVWVGYLWGQNNEAEAARQHEVDAFANGQRDGWDTLPPELRDRIPAIREELRTARENFTGDRFPTGNYTDAFAKSGSDVVWQYAVALNEELLDLHRQDRGRPNGVGLEATKFLADELHDAPVEVLMQAWHLAKTSPDPELANAYAAIVEGATRNISARCDSPEELNELIVYFIAEAKRPGATERGNIPDQVALTIVDRAADALIGQSNVISEIQRAYAHKAMVIQLRKGGLASPIEAFSVSLMSDKSAVVTIGGRPQGPGLPAFPGDAWLIGAPRSQCVADALTADPRQLPGAVPGRVDGGRSDLLPGDSTSGGTGPDGPGLPGSRGSQQEGKAGPFTLGS